MKKISSQNAQMVLKQASAAIRHLAQENSSLKEKIAQTAKAQRIEKIAKAMEEKGLCSEFSFEEKIASLRTADLDVTERAIDLSAPAIKLASVSDTQAGNALSAFENFILTGDAE